jgi:K(+)-stimulated pyrophosphate-energized sodium pump
MLTNAILPVAFGAFGMIAAFMIYTNIVKTPSGEGRVKEIADEIHLGAMVFMASEYKRLAIFCLICIVALYSSLGADTAIAFTLGALCSGTAGYIGMYSATKANVRTAVAANTKGAAAALNVAFFGGSIMGLTVASMGLLGIGILYHFMGGTAHGIEAIEGFAMGGSSVALFSRVGGGIFTKSADVGADLVGKVEAGIPEDDPRNPAVIADNVGDNVGDVAGMGSDIFESYCGAMIASIALAASMSIENIARLGGDQTVLEQKRRCSPKIWYNWVGSDLHHCSLFLDPINGSIEWYLVCRFSWGYWRYCGGPCDRILHRWCTSSQNSKRRRNRSSDCDDLRPSYRHAISRNSRANNSNHYLLCE